MAPGTIVYLNWYDFNKKTEFLLKGEVVDNSDYQGTQWANFVYVSIQLNGMSAPICHHFLPPQLSTDASNVPHDDCYLVCGKKSRFMEHDVTVRRKKLNPSDAWLQVQQFKQDHWDYIHGHISTDALDEYYQLWHDAIAAKRGFTEITSPYREITSPYREITSPYREISTPYSSKPAEAPSKPKKIVKKSTPNNIIELSLFE